QVPRDRRWSPLDRIGVESRTEVDALRLVVVAVLVIRRRAVIGVRVNGAIEDIRLRALAFHHVDLAGLRGALRRVDRVLVAVEPEPGPRAVTGGPLHPDLEVAVLEGLARGLGRDRVDRVAVGRTPGVKEVAIRAQMERSARVDLLKDAPRRAWRFVVPDVVIPH